MDEGEAKGSPDGGLPWWPVERGRSAERAPLTREQIVAAALRVVDAEGLDALSMRRLGKELDAGATSIYWHVKDKDELLDLVLDGVIGEVSFAADDASGPWRERVADIARDLRRVLIRHRNIAAVLGSRVTVGPNALAGVDHLVGVFRGAGFDGRDLVLAYSTVLNFAVGFAVFEVRGVSGSMAEGRTLDELQEVMAAMLSSLPVGRFPNIVAMAPAMIGMTDDDQFEFGLRRLLDGLEADLERRRDGAGEA